MKKKSNLILPLCMALLTAGSLIAQTPIRIMPLGDSITHGVGAAGGYRLPLYIALENAGYTVDFIGSSTENPASGLGSEINHEGHSGWRVSHSSIGLYEHLYGWFEQIEDPHVVLIHAGTNDTNDPDFEHCIDEMDAMITRIAECQPDAEIILTTLMKRGAEDLSDSRYIAITNYFNPYVYPLVTNHVAQGHNVHYLDMHAYVELADMDDNLHPNAVGYQKMADAWFPAITNIIGTSPANNRPAAMRAVGGGDRNSITITFNKELSESSATNTANYAVSSGITTLSASLSGDQRTITLTTSEQPAGTSHTVTLNNIQDESTPTALSIPANTQLDFFALTESGAENHVDEYEDYTMVYSMNIPSAVAYNSTAVIYSTDNSAKIPDGSFSRTAYYIELLKDGEDLQYLWVSMDSFATDASLIGIPVPSMGAYYQQYVNNLKIYSNVGTVTTGTSPNGNIEFWPTNYGRENTTGIPGASETTYDFGDTKTPGTYGCMQLHNYLAGETLFAFNNWGGSGGDVCLGIGNNPSGNPDWTFMNNGASYTVKTLQVYVKVDTVETTPPTAVSADAGAAGTLVTVEFMEELSTDSVGSGCFAIDNGVSVISAELLADKKRVNIITSSQPAGTSLTLTINNVRDLSGNKIVANSTIAITPYALPASIASNAGTLADGYKHILTLDINTHNNFNNSGMEIYSYDQSSLTGAFDRVGYYLEFLLPNGSTQYVWTSMDAFTMSKEQLGVPTFKSGGVFQQYVNNLVVKSNKSGVWNGTNTTGNIEFWPYDYQAGNTLSIPGASGSSYDFGDNCAYNNNYGSMQVHNYLEGQTVFGFNNWNRGEEAGLGIGSRSVDSPDWTHAYNAQNDYVKRTLYVLVRPSESYPESVVPIAPAAVTENIPASSNYMHAYTIDIPVKGFFNISSSNQVYTSTDNTGTIPPYFKRVAYYLELVSGTTTQWVWTAMDSFTDDYTKLKIPLSGTVFQQNISNLDVRSNVGGVTEGDGFSTGNIEFFASNYIDDNINSIPGASYSYFDWGDDEGSNTGTGHGCMQVHNYGESQTLFAINHFNIGNTVALGIGNENAPGSGHTDYTFNYNAGSYDKRTLHIFVQPDYAATGATAAPAVDRHVVSRELNAIAVTFNTEVADSAATLANFSLDNGVSVSTATLLPNHRTVRLETSALSEGQTYTLTLSGIMARAADGEAIAAGTTYGFTVENLDLPEFMTGIPEIGNYNLAYQLAVDARTYYANGCNYTFDQSLFPQSDSIERIAYCMELEDSSTGYHWVYVSMDAFSYDLEKIGVPTADRKTTWQQYVNNLNIYASANIANSTVTTGVDIASGNIEFWFSNYTDDNSKSIPGASDSAYDFGDQINGTTAGYGSMQVHNYAEGHTIFAMNNWGSNNREPCIGIGNDPNTGRTDYNPDWTFASNADDYSTRNIYVLVKYSDNLAEITESGDVEILLQPQSVTVDEGETVALSVYAPEGQSYQWLKNGYIVPEATSPTLEIADSKPGDSAQYTVAITDSDGDVALSEPATVKVISHGTRLIIR